MSRFRRNVGLALAGLALALAPARAQEGDWTLRYSLAIPEGQAVTYRLELQVEHPGPLEVRAAWSGDRRLALRLEGPSRAVRPQRRAGPSPVGLAAGVGADETGIWELTIHSLAARGAGEGELTIELPRPALSRPETTPPEPDPIARPHDSSGALWTRPVPLPAAATPAERRFVQAVGRFRSLLLTGDRGPDNCRWQEDTATWLHAAAARLAAGEALPAASTRELLQRIADAVETVERLRASEDPLLAGPGPADPGLREAWLRLRAERIQLIEAELDRVLRFAEGGYAPELDAFDWPQRLVSCVTACERHFDERVPLGDRAINRELATAQWDLLRTASEALAALAALADEPVVATPQFRVR